eukprot:14387836-Heterocapsa_arctica.AAC.1
MPVASKATHRAMIATGVKPMLVTSQLWSTTGNFISIQYTEHSVNRDHSSCCIVEILKRQ